MEAVKEKLIEHDYAIKQIGESLHNLAETTKDGNDKLEKIANSMGKQEVILEKLANLEINSKASINRVHRRVDTLETKVKECSGAKEVSGCTALQLLQEKESNTEKDFDTKIKAIADRVTKTESTITWLTRTIVGTAISGGLGFLIYVARHFGA